MRHLEVREVFALLPDEGAAESVRGHLVDRGDDRVHHLGVVDVAALRAVPHQNAHGVHDGEGRAHEGGKVGDRGVDVLVKSVSSPAENAVPVLHGGGVFGQVVVLGHGHVDDLVGLDEGRENGPLVEHFALQARRTEPMLRRKDHLGAEAMRFVPDARALEAALGIVAASVGDDHALGAGLERHLHDRPDHVWVGVRGVDGHAIPTDVRLDDDDVATGNEALHAAHRFDGLANDGVGARVVLVFRPTCDDEVCGLRGFFHTVVAYLACAFARACTEAALVPDGASDERSAGEHPCRGTHARQHFATCRHLTWRGRSGRSRGTLSSSPAFGSRGAVACVGRGFFRGHRP